MPAVYSFGQADRFVLVELSGRMKFRESFLYTLRQEVPQTNWWQFEDRRDSGISSDIQPETGEVQVKIQIYNVDLDKRYKPEADPDEVEDSSSVEFSTSWEGLVSFAVTAVGPDGRVVMRESEYTASGEAEDTREAEERLKKELLREAIQEFLNDITPREEALRLRVDEKRDDMEPVAELIQERRYHSALERLEKMGENYPHRPDVLYNTGIVLQGMGRYTEALDYYNRAIQNGPKNYYYKTRQHCLDRLDAIEELEQ